MDLFEDSLLEDVINFTGKNQLTKVHDHKSKHRSQMRGEDDGPDEGESQSSDEIYIFKRAPDSETESSLNLGNSNIKKSNHPNTSTTTHTSLVIH